MNGDRTPKRKRRSAISQEIKDFIKEYRQERGSIHQDEIKAHLDKYCKGKMIKSTSVASIGRIIRKLKDKRELRDVVKLKLDGKSGKISEIKTKYKAKEQIGKHKPGDLLQADSVHLTIACKKRYLTNAVDVKGRLAFSCECDRLNSENNVEDFRS
jgi:hypothetical protein